MTDIITAMENRHAVRAYDPEKKIPKEITDKLREKIALAYIFLQCVLACT